MTNDNATPSGGSSAGRQDLRSALSAGHGFQPMGHSMPDDAPTSGIWGALGFLAGVVIWAGLFAAVFVGAPAVKNAITGFLTGR